MSIRPQFSNQDVEVLTTTKLYDGFFKMVQYKVKHKLFAGGWSDVVTREMFERGHAVALLPYDPNTQEFVLIEQFRLGAMATSDSPWLMEVIAGMIDDGYSAEDICHKEAHEEAGIRLSHLTKACSYLSSPGGTTERLHIFMAKTDATQADGIHGIDDESEDILVHRVPEGTAKQWLDSGRIDNAAAIIALQYFFLNKQKIIADWQ
ncbi:MAG TPA: ADP-ribose diphosphatase [Glaciecola sp.]|jgi:ADP-ribose pyrophosphatase|nr:ADP-ribose diphosphatase [Glaciecola sp.]